MRPTLDKMFEGINYALLNDIMPELSSSFAMTRVLILSLTINQISATWQNTAQFPLIEENKDLRDVLAAASRTLEATKQDYKNESLEGLTREIDAELQREYPSGEDYPVLQSLLEENCNLKEVLVNTITALEEINRDYKSQALDELRKKIRAHLRKHLNRQLSFQAQLGGG
ncbi:hypothetical protein ES703_56556 [subsurface metagenome]